jgi:hypothetical protein
MGEWRNEIEGGRARVDDQLGPKPGHAWQATGPGDDEWNGRTSDPSPRLGEDTRLYRRARVTAS